MNRLLRYADILELTNLLEERGYNDCGITIELKVPTKEAFDIINEDYFLRSKYGEQTIPNDIKSFTVSTGSIKYRYVLDED